ncbi:Hint domain-containing protein [Shimia sp. Alg240-R146]|uniref:Hint domain-containing protein n=1 Tax=Shimia sp. Alg240-R146 TaxID=2993449 RepID=UPI0022E35FE2|nr:Hint domain-containing protein [Shimia sp. Alg240-R146]
MPDYLVSGWALEDFSGALAADATGTTGSGLVGTSTTLDAGADQLSFYITDDDDQLEDAYIETGTLSVLTNDLTIGGVTYPAGSNIESEYQVITEDVPPITFIIGRIGTGTSNSGSNLVVFTTSPITPGQTVTFGGISDGPVDPYDTICFAQGTRVATPSGDCAIESLREGDEIVTEQGTDRILWIGSRHFSAFDLCNNRQLRPVVVTKDALGMGRPSADLRLSPQHRVLLSDWRAELLFGEDEVLVPIKSLINDHAIKTDSAAQTITYFHILLERHGLLKAQGIWAESLFPGEEVATILTQEQKAEINALRPGFFDDVAPRYTSARVMLRPREASLLR